MISELEKESSDIAAVTRADQTQTLGLNQDFHATRKHSEHICAPLEIEDYGLQVAPFVSPPKWHLAHTSWFFETFILKPFAKSYQPIDAAFEILFNSYYNGIGEQYPRHQRGWLSRPTVVEILAYRKHVDLSMEALLEDLQNEHRAEIIERCILGIQHEKQHQELTYTDIKYSLFQNPLYPAHSLANNYLAASNNDANSDQQPLHWLAYEGGLVEIGATEIDSAEIDSAKISATETDDASTPPFAFDNESPKHTLFLQPFSLANRLVSNADFQAFIDDGGYQRSELWLADGWSVVQQQNWQQPLYWLEKDGQNYEFTLHGLRRRQSHAPVCHLSGFEADAYASWAGARLPTEAEWEHAVSQQVDQFAGSSSSSSEPSQLHPRANTAGVTETSLTQLFDQCWQWTSTAYRPYPGFKASEGAIGEYNGKFMCNQWVLRGGSCVSPNNHLRSTYRNFFYPEDRWQFSGLRLAK